MKYFKYTGKHRKDYVRQYILNQPHLLDTAGLLYLHWGSQGYMRLHLK